MKILTPSNITELFFVCLSAFLGFLFAIIVELWHKKHEEKSSRRALLKAIENEILSIKKDAEGLKGDLYYITPLEKPFWESAVHSGTISLISDSEIYLQLLNIYAMVDAINRWENMKTQIYYDKGSFNHDEINNIITEYISVLCKEIETTLNK